MLNKIELHNFKCFDEIDLPFRRLNVLTGVNGSGKSTVIQAILLLRQSFQKNELREGLELRGNYVELGNGRDVLFEKAEHDGFIGMKLDDNELYHYDFQYFSDANVLPCAYNNQDVKLHDIITTDGFVYLSADRIVPKLTYKIGNVADVEKRRFGKQGEYALQYFDMHSDDVYISGDGQGTLSENVVKWLMEISPGVDPIVNVKRDLDLSELRFGFVEGDNRTSPYRAVNVGFGLTYVLPVVISLLSARTGDYIIIENPEAHIHPRGQRKLGELIASVIRNGAQVFVETHSDHLMNGIRLSVKENAISYEDCEFLYFYQNERFEHGYLLPYLDQNGRFDNWPEGFFDEWNISMMELL